MVSKEGILSIINNSIDPKEFRDRHWEGTYYQYLAMVAENPNIARNAFQRIYDLIIHYGSERYTWLKEDFIRYNFFSDPFNGGADAIFGLDGALMELIDFLKAGAHGYGPERRINVSMCG